MKLEDQVTSLELSKELKTVGVPQDSLFYWRLSYHTSEHLEEGVVVSREGVFGEYKLEYYPRPRYTTANVKWNEADLSKLDETEISAFTCSELGEMLPKGYFTHRIFENWDSGYIHTLENWQGKSEECSTEANARAKMILYLVKEGLLKFN